MTETPLFEKGDDYRRHRPDYPVELFDLLARLSPARHRALDLGCGTGQACRALTSCFDQVVGADLSLSQLRAAPPGPSRYLAARADALPIADNRIDLITVAQALHWFPLPAFFHEAERVLVDDGLLAIISYGLCTVEGLEGLIETFHDQELRPWWPAARWLVVDGYRRIPMPWPEKAGLPAMTLTRRWTWREMVGYLDTWSALVKAREAGEYPLKNFLPTLRARWGERRRMVRWPLRLRCCARPPR